MSGTRWTDEQQSVIDARGCNMIVSAAAGSGKTAVLVERIITKILDENNPVDIDKLLVVTFTNAAAAQMKEKIMAALEKKLIEEPENAHLKRQQLLLHNAHIMTIHSFCLSVIRSYFQMIDLDPAFRIADEEELLLIKADVMSQLLEENYQAGSEEFLELMECYGTSKSDKPIEELIESLYTFALGYPWHESWLLECLNEYSLETVDELENSRVVKLLMEHCTEMLNSAKEINAQFQKKPKFIDLQYNYVLQSDESLINRLLSAKTYRELYDEISKVGYERLPSSRNAAPLEGVTLDELKEMREKVKDIINTIRAQFFFQEPEEMAADIIKSERPMAELVRLTIDYGKKLSEQKSKLNVIDFSDIEHFALEILLEGEGDLARPTTAAIELRESFLEIMIDEYQDSNYVQERILGAIAGSNGDMPHMFTVGDVKQSIYKFRLARPSLFIDRYERYEAGKDGRCFDLHKNFRSRSEVIDSVNDVFFKLMHREVGDIEYDASAALCVGAEFVPSQSMKSELRIIDVDDLGETQEDSALRIEAAAVAQRILELTDEQKGLMVTDEETKQLRRCNFGDIVVLLRTMSGWSEEFVRVFAEYGINAVSDVQTGFFSAIEIQTMLSYLNILDNPLQDIPFAAVLHSPVVGLDSDALAQLRIYGGSDVKFFYAAVAYEQSGSDEQIKEKLSKFFKDYFELRVLARSTELPQLLLEVYERTGYYDYVTAMPAGDRRRANLDMLIDKARAVMSTNYNGLFGFIRYIEKLEKYEVDYGEAYAASKEEAVRIMSIHRSKGLEFPVVILAGTGKQFNKMDSRAKVVLHPDYGMGPDCIDIKLRTKIPTLAKKVLAQLTINEGIGEELRVLYVAMTRAKEKLIISGTAKSTMKLSRQSEGEKPDFSALIAAQGYLKLLYPVVDEKYFDIIRTTATQVEENALEYGRLLSDRAKKPEGWSVDDKVIEEIRTLRDSKYEFSELDYIPVKVSVSELKAADYDADVHNMAPVEEETSQELPVPSFMSGEEKLPGAAYGTLYHKVLEKISFNMKTVDEVQAYLEQLVDEGIITDEEVKRINAADFVKFFKTPLALRMAEAQQRGELFTERVFAVNMTADRLGIRPGSDEPVLVQGIVDAYFIEDGRLVIVDYKTDRVKHEDSLRARYKKQLEYYDEALSRLTGMQVSQRIIYSFCLGCEIEL